MNRDHARALAAIRDQAVRTEVARALGSADTVARHLPIHEVPAVVEALWLAFVATDERDNPDRFSEPARRVLLSLAAQQVQAVGARLDMFGLLREGPADTP